MSRREKTVTITAEGRDKGKSYQITEMPASQGERWAARAFLALGHSGLQIDDEVAGLGMAGIAAVGIKAIAGVAFAEAEPLMDEMFACIKFSPDPARPMLNRMLIETDCEEIATRLLLRSEVLDLHLGFSLRGALSTWASQARAMAASLSATTSTAQGQSAPLSPPASQH